MKALWRVGAAVAALLIARMVLAVALQSTDLMGALSRAHDGHYAAAVGAGLYLWIHGLVVLLLPPLVAAQLACALYDRWAGRRAIERG